MSETVRVQDVARPGTRWSKAAMREIVTRFREIKKANNTTYLTPQMVLDDAKAKSSPLHKYFEWDDTKAAARWRLEQARKLIQQHYIIVTVGDEKPITGRANVVVTVDKARRYMDTVNVLDDDKFSAQVLTRAREEMRAWITRYSQFKEMREAIVEAEKIVRKLL